MTHFQKLGIAIILDWVSFDFAQRYHKSSLWVARTYHIFQNPRFFGSKKRDPSQKFPNSGKGSKKNGENISQLSRADVEAARAALTEYLHSTRSLLFVDADYISRNSPVFLKKLLSKAKNEEEVSWSMARFLRYHPINEFEPFFESIGLTHSEYSHFLPRNLMFLKDDALMLENYHVLCNYGIARNRMGYIYKEAKEIFRYNFGVLQSKFQVLKEMGLSQSSIIKVVSSCPCLLIGGNSKELHKLLEKFKIIGIEFHLIEGHIVEGNSYNWSDMYEILCLLSNMGCSDEELRKLISDSPLLPLEASKTTCQSLIGLFIKLGLEDSEICYIFLEFPDIPIEKFLNNLRNCYQFLVDIGMEAQDIGRIVRSHPLVLGSCSLKKVNSLLANLSTGKKRLCDLVNENPEILKNWVLGSKIKKLLTLEEIIRSREMKIKFLSNLGFVENTLEMQMALKVFRGKGKELQERFDYLVKVGLSKDDVVEMIKVAPQILNQKKEVIRAKIDFLVNDLGYPVSNLVSFPAYISYTRPRVKLRHLMYNWLKERGRVEPHLSLSTIIACSETVYMKRYAKKHPRGPEVFEKMKKEIYSDPKLYVYSTMDL